MFKLCMSIVLSFMLIIPMIASENEYRKSGLLIFLDNNEVELGIASMALITALYENAGPIIVSTKLLSHIFNNYTRSNTLEDPQETLIKINNFRSNRSTNLITTQELKQILLDILQFNENKWILKSIDSGLCLMIPIAYLRSYNVTQADVDRTVIEETATPTELALGLKVNHMKTMPLREIIYNSSESYNFVENVYNSTTKKSVIFCLRSDYKNYHGKIPSWSWYMNGHGNKNEKIAGIALDDFKLLLNYLEDKINMNLLVYTSCYAAGYNAERLYKDAESPIQKTYPFTIMTEAITDVPVYRAALPAFTIEHGKLIMTPSVDYVAFLREVTTAETTSYQKVADALFVPTPRSMSGEFVRNIPQIKIANLEWFSAFNSNKDIVSIGANLTQARSPLKPLNITTYFKTDPNALLIYTSTIPFELIINSRNLEAIISMVPNTVIHRFERISSELHDIFTILNWFMSVKELDARKIFYIKSINNIHDVVIYNNVIKANIIHDIPQSYETYALYYKNGKIYKQSAQDFEVIADIKGQELYASLIAEAVGKNITYAELNIDRFSPIPTFGSNTLIERVVSPFSSNPQFIMYDSDIIRKIKQSITKIGSIIWIKSLESNFGGSIFRIPNLKVGERIILADVIIDENQHVFYTYNNEFYEDYKKIAADYKDAIAKRFESKTITPSHPLTNFDFSKKPTYKTLEYENEMLFSLINQLNILSA